MRNVFKIISSVGAAALLLSGAATAGPPQAFGNWTVNSAGAILDSTTPCLGAVKGVGFEQCQVVIGDESFIRTRIAEATGGFAITPGTAPTNVALDVLAFRSEDFVKINATGAGGGLASSMTITDSTTNVGTTFGTSADILSGWAVTPNANPLLTNKTEATLRMTLNTVESSLNAHDAFGSTFLVKTVTPATGANTIETMSIGQTVGLGVATDRQRFEFMQVGLDKATYTGQLIVGIGAFSNTASTGAVNAKVTSLADQNASAAVWTVPPFVALPTF